MEDCVANHRKSENPFNSLASRYDAWFDTPRGQKLFSAELDCIEDLLDNMARPWLEVGVGTGRFAQALGIDYGVDTSFSMLKTAKKFGLQVQAGIAEALPYQEASYGTVLMIVTICFLSDPCAALKECSRILRPGGHLIIAFVPADSSWGKSYEQKGREGQPFYSVAKFYRSKDIVKVANEARFFLKRARSCLLEPPDPPLTAYAPALNCVAPGAGFVSLLFELNT